MGANPLLGVFFHWIGGLAAASFYVPYKRIRMWSWEVFWLVGGIMSWVIAPWVFAAINTQDLFGVLAATPGDTLFWCYFWGAMWGFGGLTFGLTLRYLGISLGMAVALGLTTVIGTLGPPIYDGTLGETASTTSGQLTLVGIVMTLLGIAVVAKAGAAKERDMGGARQIGVAEFNLKRGLLIAVFSGVMSGCMAWGLDAGQPIRELTLAAGTGELSQGLPVLCVVLLGGFTTNAIWCAMLIGKNRSLGQLVGNDAAAPAPGAEVTGGRMPLAMNYLLACTGGAIWYFQFFFYTMGESQMGRYGFSSWTLHMASIILFSTLWGFALKEWKQASGKTRATVWLGIALLVGSTVVIGLGNMLDGSLASH
ncbi:L-rhamnose/proton symporter RhaT [Altericroceibacterium endophyticum]|uniref:L-rhamnose/proton symporter RhaT n=1 Tax=Altericroceibacterium endophyticum TaxID=1808508 RepID=A0A6I4TBU5_9SPHN|nr:L-rhamnose/proton symporter RhaT [Altericroceibacterium endophyticum]MXO67205.1 L-rhamnose/proton symporter RhaT [Altericroceibacterium endophyticum]